MKLKFPWMYRCLLLLLAAHAVGLSSGCGLLVAGAAGGAAGAAVAHEVDDDDGDDD